MFTEFRARLGTLWCVHNHESVTWPIHGQYQCRSCGRRFLTFVEPPVEKPAASPAFDVSARIV